LTQSSRLGGARVDAELCTMMWAARRCIVRNVIVRPNQRHGCPNFMVASRYGYGAERCAFGRV